MENFDWNLTGVKRATLAVDNSPPAALNPEFVEFQGE
jgi:hypothetical protein